MWTTGEFDDGITSVAAPVVGPSGAVVAAMHCHGPSYRFPRRRATPTPISRGTSTDDAARDARRDCCP